MRDKDTSALREMYQYSSLAEKPIDQWEIATHWRYFQIQDKDLKWLILGTIDDVLEGEDDCDQWGGRLPYASEGKETWREKHKGCIFTSLIKMIEVFAFRSPRVRWWARTRWSTRWRWLESQTLSVSRSSRELHSLDRFHIVASKCKDKHEYGHYET